MPIHQTAAGVVIAAKICTKLEMEISSEGTFSNLAN